MRPTSSSEDQQTSEVSNLHSAFDVLDVDGDGKISQEDLRASYGAFSSCDTSADEDIIGFMIAVADSNKDGFVEYDEFEKILQSRNMSEVKNGRWSLMQHVFRMMDKDGDGKVGHHDLKSYLKWAGMDANDEDVNAMIKLSGGDENGAGGATFDGFLRILAI